MQPFPMQVYELPTIVRGLPVQSTKHLFFFHGLVALGLLALVVVVVKLIMTFMEIYPNE